MLGSRIPNNLPQISAFFGREKELKTIAKALAPEARTWGVLIDGPGGIGKTTLAIRAAELLTEGQFKRIIFISSKERGMTKDDAPPNQGFVVPGHLAIFNEIARLIAQPAISKSVEKDRASRVLAALAGENVLIILDKLDSLPPEEREQVYDLLVHLPIGCKAIVTSRRRTDVDARVIRLEKLDRRSALAYLHELAKRHPLLSKSTAEERVELYEETGGSPILIRWIVGHLGRGQCSTISQALKLLRQAPDSIEPLEFAFDNLLETFTREEAAILSALTHFTTAVSIDTISELSALPQQTTATALDDLNERALVIADSACAHFMLTPLVANFLRLKRPSFIEETGRRLESLIYALVMEYGYDNHERFPVLDTEWTTIEAALPRFLMGSNYRLQKVCKALSRFLNFTGRWDEWLALVQGAEKRAVEEGDFANAGWRVFEAGRIHGFRGQASEVLASAKHAEAHWQLAPTNTGSVAAAIRLSGIGHELAGNYRAAFEAYREALKLWRTLDLESDEVAICTDDLAGAALRCGDYDAAECYYREVLRISQVKAAEEGVATATSNLAALALSRHDWLGAEDLARKGLLLAEKIGRQELIARCYLRLAQSLVHQSRTAESRHVVERAVDIYMNLDSPALAEAQDTLAECVKLSQTTMFEIEPTAENATSTNA